MHTDIAHILQHKSSVFLSELDVQVPRSSRAVSWFHILHRVCNTRREANEKLHTKQRQQVPVMEGSKQLKVCLIMLKLQFSLVKVYNSGN